MPFITQSRKCARIAFTVCTCGIGFAGSTPTPKLLPGQFGPVFGVSDEALFDVLLGKVAPTGKLPFEMPSSMDAVRAQLEDVPHDSKDPLFAIGFGLLAFSSFVFDTMDVCTRLGRYVLQEMTGLRGTLGGIVKSTGLTVEEFLAQR